MNFPGDNSLRLNFNSPFGEYHTVKFACDDHVIAFYLTLHPRTLSKDETMAGNHVALHLGVDTKYAGGFQGSLKLHPFIEKAGELLALRVLATPF